jgi:RNA polymerase sigma-70 factor (ECF subfamily)
VLEFSAQDIADTLETTTASVNSALQRARESLHAQRVLERELDEPTETQRELVERYVDAFHRYDVDALVALLREDGTLSMPPYTLWLEGPAAVKAWFLGRGVGCRGSRLVPTRASGSIAFGQYRRVDDGGHTAWSLVVLDLDADRIRSMTHFLDVESLFPLHDLPLRLDA